MQREIKLGTIKFNHNLENYTAYLNIQINKDYSSCLKRKPLKFSVKGKLVNPNNSETFYFDELDILENEKFVNMDLFEEIVRLWLYNQDRYIDSRNKKDSIPIDDVNIIKYIIKYGTLP